MLCLRQMLLLIVLLGCTVSPRCDCYDAILIGQDRTSTTRDALIRTVEDFSGHHGNGGAGNQSGGGGGDITVNPEVLSPDSTTPYRINSNRSFGWRRSASTDLSAGWQVWWAGTVAIGQNSYELPQGMGVLTDPTQIDVYNLTIQPELSISRKFNLGGIDVSGGTGLGWQISRNRVTVQSALLDVTSNSTNAEPYVFTSLELHPHLLPGTVAVETRIADDGSTQVRAELRFLVAR